MQYVLAMQKISSAQFHRSAGRCGYSCNTADRVVREWTSHSRRHTELCCLILRCQRATLFSPCLLLFLDVLGKGVHCSVRASFSEKQGEREKVRLFRVVFIFLWYINRSKTIEAAECLVKYWCITFMFSKAAGASQVYADYGKGSYG